MNKAIIYTKNLSKKFNNNEVLNNINISFNKEKITGIIGYNGSGKTVLLKIIVGLYKPTSGEVVIDDKLTIYDDFGVLIDTGFIEYESGFKNLKLISLLKNKIKDKDIYDIMRFVKLDPFNKTKYKNYSTGMKQKLKIAQALMEKPKVLVLDEPFNGLDKESVLYFRKVLLDLKEKGTTIIITSHYEEDIKTLCDYVYEINKGELTLYEKK